MLCGLGIDRARQLITPAPRVLIVADHEHPPYADLYVDGQLHSEWEPADGLIYSVLSDTLDEGKAWAGDPASHTAPSAPTNHAHDFTTASTQREH